VNTAEKKGNSALEKRIVKARPGLRKKNPARLVRAHGRIDRKIDKKKTSKTSPERLKTAAGRQRPIVLPLQEHPPEILPKNRDTPRRTIGHNTAVYRNPPCFPLSNHPRQSSPLYRGKHITTH
jgi:hypothetical protein